MNVTVTNVSCGPTVTRYELQPEMGVKVSKIVGLADDIKLNLATPDIRIEAPIPGKAAVGIEVPNKENSTVMLRDLLQSEEFQKAKSKLSFAVGKDIAGKKFGLIACCEEDDMTVMDGVRIPLERSAALLKWVVVGEVRVPAVLNEGDINKTDGCAKAAELAHKF